MPEIVEAYTIADSLNKALSGNPTVISTFFAPKCKVTGEKNWELTDSKTVSVFSRGKKVIFHQVEHDTDREFFIIFYLSMTGIFMDTEGKHTKFKLEYDNDENVYFDDSRGFGQIIFAEDFQEFLNDIIGPDLIQDAVTVDDWLSVMSNTGQGMSISSFMFEQRYFAGVGNYLLNEILYDARIMANRKLLKLTQEERIRLFNSTKKIIGKALKARGLSISDYRDFRGVLGSFVPKVYGVKGMNADGYKVVNATVNSKVIWYVPEVQMQKDDVEPKKRAKKKVINEDKEVLRDSD